MKHRCAYLCKTKMPARLSGVPLVCFPGPLLLSSARWRPFRAVPEVPHRVQTDGWGALVLIVPSSPVKSASIFIQTKENPQRRDRVSSQSPDAQAGAGEPGKDYASPGIWGRPRVSRPSYRSWTCPTTHLLTFCLPPATKSGTSERREGSSLMGRGEEGGGGRDP